MGRLTTSPPSSPSSEKSELSESSVDSRLSAPDRLGIPLTGVSGIGASSSLESAKRLLKGLAFRPTLEPERRPARPVRAGWVAAFCLEDLPKPGRRSGDLVRSGELERVLIVRVGVSRIVARI